MKNWAIVILCLVLAFALVGCCTNEPGDAGDNSGDTATNATPEVDEGGNNDKVLAVQLVFEEEPEEGSQYAVVVKGKESYAGSLSFVTKDEYGFQGTFYTIGMDIFSEVQDVVLQVFPYDENGVHFDEAVSEKIYLTYVDNVIVEGDYLEIMITQ